ncbi:MAG: hypothetical protein H7A45_19245 [Verrucomicrobiales bacterium]|nr:hypothetical protein [Verrucomicrobiales bacterium]MCP5526958.1 hypothetical protein [Verrucomicrobiales bacterium]
MSSFVSQLNLRPHERRILFVVLAAVFLLVNAVFVWPRFGDWHTAQQTFQESLKKRSDYQAEIDRIPGYQRRIRELEGQGSAVLPEEQALQLLRIVQAKAQEHRVAITQTRAVSTTSSLTSTNVFFDEQAITVGVNTGGEELVAFLHAIGSGDSMIRVRDMDLRPDQRRYKLVGNITLVASYQKKTRPASGARRPRGGN